MKLRLFSFLFLILSSCSPSNVSNVISYCNPDDLNWKSGGMNIDLENKKVFGDDVSSFIAPLKVGNLYGFNIPFPILLFDKSIDRNELKGEINSGSHLFTFTPLKTDHDDLWVIVAKPDQLSDDKRKAFYQSSIVFYSIQNGVLSMNISSSTLNPPYITNFYPCNNKTITYENVKEIN